VLVELVSQSEPICDVPTVGIIVGNHSPPCFPTRAIAAEVDTFTTNACVINRIVIPCMAIPEGYAFRAYCWENVPFFLRACVKSLFRSCDSQVILADLGRQEAVGCAFGFAVKA